MSGYLLQSDAARIPLRDQSVHCVITSPPYWGMRRYEGDPSPGMFPNFGHEKDLADHIDNMVIICREIWRVLRDDGVFWLNYADGYANQRGSTQFKPAYKSLHEHGGHQDRAGATFMGLKPGNIMLMPHRIAIALQEDGWILRNDLVWNKPNPMPESIKGRYWAQHRIKVQKSGHAETHNIKGGHEAMLKNPISHQGMSEDWLAKYVDCPGCRKCEPNDGMILHRDSWRHTRAHEYVFPFVKSMGYWSNSEAVRELGTSNASDRKKMAEAKPRIGGKHKTLVDPLNKASAATQIGRQRSVGSKMRNPRSVVDVATAPYKGAHYATFPAKLITPLIRATCPRRACSVCGEGWAPIVERPDQSQRPTRAEAKQSGQRISTGWGEREQSAGQQWQDWKDENPDRVIGWRPSCDHDAPPVPGIVVDPFVGSGTTVMVAEQLLRRGIGLDISMPYLEGQAKLRASLGSPRAALDGLPLFEGLSEPGPSGAARAPEND